MTTSPPPPPPAQQVLDEVAPWLDGTVRRVEYVASGAANHVFRLVTGSGTYVLKSSVVDEPGLLAHEARALRHLASTGTVTVPAVVAVTASALVLEDLGPQPRPPDDDDWGLLGAQLGRLHSVTAPQFGYDEDNVLGIWPQRNPWTDDWLAFYAENRVLCHLDVGLNATVLDADDRRGVERVLAALGPQVPAQPPALCHGDLWRGNLHLGASGRFSVIDPAIHFGHAEQDLAQTQMYEVFPPAFYEGYRDAHPLDEGWTQRLPLYQLKELLLMVAQFGHEDSLRTLRELARRYR